MARVLESPTLRSNQLYTLALFRLYSLCQVGDELEVVHDLATASSTTLDTKRQNTSEAPRKVLLGQLVRRVALQTQIGHPGDIGVALQPLGQLQRILCVPLAAQAQRLNAQQQLLRGKWIQGRAQISEDLHSNANGKCDGSEGVPELEAVVSLGWVVELRESLCVLAPVELSAVDYDASNCSTVATNPFGGGVDDDVGAVVDGTDEVASSSEGVVNLAIWRQ